MQFACSMDAVGELHTDAEVRTERALQDDKASEPSRKPETLLTTHSSAVHIPLLVLSRISQEETP